MPVRLDVNGRAVSVHVELCFLNFLLEGELRTAAVPMFTDS